MVRRNILALWAFLGIVLGVQPVMAQIVADSYVSLTTNEDTSVQGSLPTGLILATKPPSFGISTAVTILRAPANGYIRFKDQASSLVTKDFIYRPNPNFYGTDTIILSVTDTKTVKTYRITYGITVVQVNDAPFVWAPSKIYAQPGRTLQSEIYIRDADSNALTVTAQNLPNGATFDSKTHVLTWLPQSKDLGTYTVRISAKDGVTETLKDVPLEVVAERTPRRVWYDGITNNFMEGIGWDTTGSNVKEATAGSNKYILYTINNQNWWGAAAYSFGSNTETDLSAYSSLKFDIWANANVSAVIYLVDYMTGKESVKRTLALTTQATPIELSLDEIRGKGFDISKTTSIVIATSLANTVTYTIGMDNLITEGSTPVAFPAPFEPFIEFVSDKDNFRVSVPNLGTHKIEKVAWHTIGVDLLPLDSTTTTDSIAKSTYFGCACSSLSAKVTIDGVDYQSTLSGSIIYTAEPPPASSTYRMLPQTDSDIVMDGLYTSASYQAQVAKSLQVEVGDVNALNLVTVTDGFRWDRGVVPYTFDNVLLPSEKGVVEQIMEEIYQKTGLVFALKGSFTTRDPLTLKEIRVKAIDANDMPQMSTDPATDAAQRAAAAAIAACQTNGLGTNASKVMLSGSIIGCMGSSAGSLGVLRHELFHILGAAHEILHKDAPRTNIQFIAIYPWQYGQFYNVKNDPLFERTKYDNDSIMRYDQFAFSICLPNAVDDKGNFLWDYSTVDKTVDATFQQNIAKLPARCQRNPTAITDPQCQTQCSSILNAGPALTDYSGLDVAGMNSMYALNKAFQDTLIALNVTRTRSQAAGILTSIVKLAQDAVNNTSLLTPGSDYVIAVQTLSRLKTTTTRRLPLTCSTSETNIVDGRKSCSKSACWTASDSGSFLAGMEQKSQFVLYEGQCNYAFQKNGTELCVAVNARSGTANGSSGYVTCTITVLETKF